MTGEPCDSAKADSTGDWFGFGLWVVCRSDWLLLESNSRSASSDELSDGLRSEKLALLSLLMVGFVVVSAVVEVVVVLFADALAGGAFEADGI